MPEYTKIIRKMRVFEFEVEMSENERRCVFVIDREDDLSTQNSGFATSDWPYQVRETPLCSHLRTMPDMPPQR